MFNLSREEEELEERRLFTMNKTREVKEAPQIIPRTEPIDFELYTRKCKDKDKGFRVSAFTCRRCHHINQIYSGLQTPDFSLSLEPEVKSQLRVTQLHETQKQLPYLEEEREQRSLGPFKFPAEANSVYSRLDVAHILPFNNDPNLDLVSGMQGLYDLRRVGLKEMRAQLFSLINQMISQGWFQSKYSSRDLLKGVSVVTSKGYVIRPNCVNVPNKICSSNKITARRFRQLTKSMLSESAYRSSAFQRVYVAFKPNYTPMQAQMYGVKSAIREVAVEAVESDQMRNAVEGLFSNLIDSDLLKQKITDTSKEVIDSLSGDEEVVNSVGSFVKDVFASGISSVGASLEEGFLWIRELLMDLWDHICALWQRISGYVVEKVTQFCNWVRSKQAQFMSFALAIMASIEDGYEDMLTYLASALEVFTGWTLNVEDWFKTSFPIGKMVSQGKDDVNMFCRIASTVISSQLDGSDKKYIPVITQTLGNAGSIFEAIKTFYRWFMFSLTGDAYYCYDKEVYLGLELVRRARRILDDPKAQQKLRVNKLYSQEISDVHTGMQDMVEHPALVAHRGGLFYQEFTQLRSRIQKFYEISHRTRQGLESRPTPIWLNLMGEPGQGKSCLVSFLLRSIHAMVAATAGSVIDENYDSRTVFTKGESEYWEGYAQQPVTSWPELFGKVGEDGRQDSAAALLSLISTEEVPLNMAFMGKGDVFFNSDFLISTSNLQYDQYNYLGVTDPQAIFRRIAFPIQLVRVADMPEHARGADLLNLMDRCWELRIPERSQFSKFTAFNECMADSDVIGSTMTVSQLLKAMVSEYMRRQSRTAVEDRFSSIDHSTMIDYLKKNCGFIPTKAEEEKSTQPISMLPKWKPKLELYKSPVIAKLMTDLYSEFDKPPEEETFIFEPRSDEEESLIDPIWGQDSEEPVEIKMKAQCKQGTCIMCQMKKRVEDNALIKEGVRPEPGNPAVGVTRYLSALIKTGTFHLVMDMVANEPKGMAVALLRDNCFAANCWLFDMEAMLKCPLITLLYPPGPFCDPDKVMYEYDTVPGILEFVRQHKKHEFRYVTPDINVERVDVLVARDQRKKVIAVATTTAIAAALSIGAIGLAVGAIFKIMKRVTMGQAQSLEDKVQKSKITKPKKVAKIRKIVKNAKAKTMKGQSLTLNQQQIAGAIANNIWHLEVVYSDHTSITVHATAIKGSVLLTTWHEFTVKNVKRIIMGKGSGKGRYEIPRDYFEIKRLEGERRDGCFVFFKKEANVALMSSIVKHVRPRAWFKKSMKNIVKLSTHRAKGEFYMLGESTGMIDLKNKPGNLTIDENNSIMVSEYYILYGGKGNDGECGLPYIQVADNGHDAALIGVHFGREGAHSLIMPIYKEDLETEEVMKAQSLKLLSYVKDTISPELNDINRLGCIPQSKSTRYYNGTGKTDYVESILVRKCREKGKEFPFENTRVPAIRETREIPVLGAAGEEARMQLMSPFMKADASWTKTTTPEMPRLMRELLATDRQYLWKNFDKGMKHSSVPYRFLTIEEVIFGLTKWISATKRSTSTGYFGLATYIKTRLDLWNPETEFIHPLFRKAVEELIEISRTGDVPGVVFLQSLKDELLPLEKVAEGKNRAFEIGDVVHFTALAMTFAMPLKMTKINGLHGAAVMGFNPHSIQSKILWSSFEKIKGSNWIAGDVSSMDFSVPPYFAYLYTHYWNDTFFHFKEGSPDFNQIYGLLRTAVNALWLRGNRLFMTFRGHPSGWFLTSHYNSFVLYVINRFIFRCCYPTLEFTTYVVFKCHGDDSSGKVHKDCPDYNMIVISECFLALFGMIMTKPDKSPIDTPYIAEEDVEFLGRKPLVTDAGICGSPLRTESLYGMLCWIRKDLDENEAIVANIEAVLLEAVMHGREFFEDIREKLIDVIQVAEIDFFPRGWPFYMTRLARKYSGGAGVGPTLLDTQVAWGSSYVEDAFHQFGDGDFC